MPKPICCQAEMEKTAIGVNVAFFTRSLGPNKPYEIWSADAFTCWICNRNIISAFAQNPMWRHHYTNAPPPITHKVYE